MGRILQVEQRMLLARRCEICRSNEIEVTVGKHSIEIKCKKCGTHFTCEFDKPEDKVKAFERVTDHWNDVMRHAIENHSVNDNQSEKLILSSIYEEFKR